MKNFSGKILFLDRSDINTDEIIPAKYLTELTKAALKPYCLEDLSLPGFDPKKDIAGKSVIITRANFGCGSSREHAPVAILGAGMPVVIAHSFARIFYRNSFNMGLLLLEVGDDVDKIHDGDELDVDASAGVIHDLTTGENIPFPPLPPSMAEILNKGGLVPYVKERLKGE